MIGYKKPAFLLLNSINTDWQYTIFLHQSETVPFDTLLPVLWIAAVVAIVAVLPVTWQVCGNGFFSS
jgi:hypothetical protein